MPRKKKTTDAAPPPDQDQPEIDAATEARRLKRQPEIPGMEREIDPVLDKLGSQYAALSAKRGQISADMKKLNAKMDQAMTERGIARYKFVDGEIEREIVVDSGQRKVKVIELATGDDE